MFTHKRLSTRVLISLLIVRQLFAVISPYPPKQRCRPTDVFRPLPSRKSAIDTEIKEIESLFAIASYLGLYGSASVKSLGLDAG
jgi:hypothetical protein